MNDSVKKIIKQNNIKNIINDDSSDDESKDLKSYLSEDMTFDRLRVIILAIIEDIDKFNKYMIFESDLDLRLQSLKIDKLGNIYYMISKDNGLSIYDLLREIVVRSSYKESIEEGIKIIKTINSINLENLEGIKDSLESIGKIKNIENKPKNYGFLKKIFPDKKEDKPRLNKLDSVFKRS